MFAKLFYAIGVILSVGRADMSVDQQLYPEEYRALTGGEGLVIYFDNGDRNVKGIDDQRLLDVSCPEFRVDVLPYNEKKWSNPLLSWYGYWQGDKSDYNKAVSLISSSPIVDVITITSVTKLKKISTCHYAADMVSARLSGPNENHLMISLYFEIGHTGEGPLWMHSH